MINDMCVLDWTSEDAKVWLKKEGNFRQEVLNILCDTHGVDGRCLLALTENDFTLEPLSALTLRDRKVLYICAKTLQRDNQSSLIQLGIAELPSIYTPVYRNGHEYSEYCDSERISPPMSEDGRAIRLQPELGKALVSVAYMFVVTWITAFVMVIVHDRVPDMKRYPPLPDIFLDNVPHIPWAFEMCELTGTVLFTVWFIVLLFHKHRFILIRRFFALSGTVFLLRCVTMLITSLSVPGSHLECQPRTDHYHTSDNNSSIINPEFLYKVTRAYEIWRGAGMSIQGVRTCGDYMFSGHTVALTMLNFFITEYTPRHYYFLHTLTWLMNMFGIFFILAAHEHYSIDVFVAFYITSRLFLYYHTLSNNQSLMQRDSVRTRIWFPLFSYFESSVDGIIPNEYDTPQMVVKNLLFWLITNIKLILKLRFSNFWTNETDRGEEKKSSHEFLTSSNKSIGLSNHSFTKQHSHVRNRSNGGEISLHDLKRSIFDKDYPPNKDIDMTSSLKEDINRTESETNLYESRKMK